MDASFHGPRMRSNLDKPGGMKEIRVVRSLIFHGLGSCSRSAEAFHFRKARIALDAKLPKWSFHTPFSSGYLSGQICAGVEPTAVASAFSILRERRWPFETMVTVVGLTRRSFAIDDSVMPRSAKAALIRACCSSSTMTSVLSSHINSMCADSQMVSLSVKSANKQNCWRSRKCAKYRT